MKINIPTSKTKKLKFVFVGDESSGKTSLFNRMSEDKFISDSTFTGVDFKFVKTCHMKVPLRIEYWDTISQEKYFSLQPSYYNNADVVYICYDVSDAEAPGKLELWLRNIEKHMEESSFICIVGCKGDLGE